MVKKIRSISNGIFFVKGKFPQISFAAFLLFLFLSVTVQAQITPIIHTADDRVASGSGTSLSVATPANLNPGDLIVLIVTSQRSSATVATYGFSTPTGFTQLATQHANTNTDGEIAAFWKIADGTEAANITSTVANNGTTPNWKAVAMRVSGVNQTTPIAASSGSNSAATSVATLAIAQLTTTTVNSMLVSAVSVRRLTTAKVTPTGMQTFVDMNGVGGADANTSEPDLRVAFEARATAAATGTRTFSWTGAAKATGLMFAINPAPVEAPSVNFARRQINTALNNPWEIQYGQDNRLWFSERGGIISRMDTSGTGKTTVYTAPDYYGGTKAYNAGGAVDSCSNYRVGTFGMAMHPDFLTNGYIYYVYTYEDGATVKAKVRRITVNVGTGAFVGGSATDIITNIPMGNDHEGLRLMAVKQNGNNYLYLTVGDLGVSETNTPACFSPQSLNPNNQAWSLTAYNGKIHRYNMDGTIPSDNPYVGNANGWLTSIYTRAHRNPQGLMYNPNANVLYNVEHGDRTDDEVNVLQPAANYGWKFARGYHDSNYPTEDSVINNYVKLTPNDTLVPALYAFAATQAQISALSTSNNTWPSTAPSDGIYYGSSAIPPLTNSLLVVTLKNGLGTSVGGNAVNPEVYQFKLTPDGKKLASPVPVKYFTADSTLNGTSGIARYRDIAISPDGKKIYMITNNNGAASTDKLIVYEYQQPAAPCWSRISERYWVNGRLFTGGTVQQGDTVTVSVVFNQNDGGTGGLNTNGSCNTTGHSNIYSFRIKKRVPSGTSYVPSTLRVTTNRDSIYAGGNTRDTLNLTKICTDAIDAGDDAFFQGDSAVFNLGAGATNTAGGRVTSTSRPRQASTRLIAQATMRVVVNAPNGSTLNLGGGVIKHAFTLGGAINEYALPDLFVKVQGNNLATPQTESVNKVTAANGGTFGTTVTTKYSPALPGDETEFAHVRNTEVYDGEYSIVLQIVQDARANPPAAPTTQDLDAAPTNDATDVVFYNAGTAPAIRGGWDVIADHTGATDPSGGNPLYNDNLGSTTDGTISTSPPRSAMLLVNGSYAPAAVFKDTTSGLVPFTDYQVSFWLRNVCNNCHNPTGISGATNDADRSNPGVLPHVAVKFGDTVLYTSGAIVYDNPTGTFGSRNTWKERKFLYSNGNKTAEQLAILNFTPGGGGNDFVLDDIVMRRVLPEVTNLGDPPPPVCQGTTVTLTATVNSENGNYDYGWYKWQTSINGGATWTDASSAVNIPEATADNYTATFTSPALTGVDEGRLYRILVATTSTNLSTIATSVAGNPFRITLNNSLGLCLPPVSYNIINKPVRNNAGNTPLDSLVSIDQDGTISNYTILTLPAASEGILRLNGSPVTVNQVLTPLQASQLTFDPDSTFVGNSSFTYRATDNNSFISNTASVSIPVFNQPPVANNFVYGFRNEGVAQAIPPISGADPENLLRTATPPFIITALPSTGTLRVNGVAATLGQLITPAQALLLSYLPSTPSYEGTVDFKYQSIDHLNQRSDTATYRIVVDLDIPLIPPVADNIMNSPINNSSGATALNPLNGFDTDGSVVTYTIDRATVPLTSKGILTYCSTGTLPSCTPTSITNGVGVLALTPDQISTLSFDPDSTALDTVRFKYTVTDNSSLISNTATVTIPLFNNRPVANPIQTSSLVKSLGQVDIPGLSGHDGDGKITSYSITSVPTATDGLLYYRLGGTGTITQITTASVGSPLVLSPAEAASLRFDPAGTGDDTTRFTYFVTDNNGRTSLSTTYTIPLFQLVPPTARDVLYNRTGNGTTSPYSPNYIPSNATWNPSDGLFGTTSPMTSLNLPIASDLDGTISNYQILTTPNRTTEGRVRFPCDAACKTAFTTAGVSLFSQGCSGVTPVALSANNSADDACLPVGTQLRVNSYNSDFVEIIPSNTPLTLTTAQMSALQFLPVGGFTGTTSFQYAARDNDGFSSNYANYYVPVSGGGSLRYPPYALDRTNDTISNTSAARILSATNGIPVAKDIDGDTISRYEIINLPLATQGVLSFCSGTLTGSGTTTGCSVALTPVTAGQSITAANINKLFFDPATTFLGVANVQYIAIDNESVNSNIANIRIPVVSLTGNPIAANISTSLPNTNSATSIPALSATDPSGSSITSYEIMSIPDATAGVLTYNNGSGQVAVTKGTALQPSQISTLQFDPAPGYSGDVIFTYDARNGIGKETNIAAYTINIRDPYPLTNHVVHNVVDRNASAFFITTPLSGTDNQAVRQFQINSIPPASQGTLQYCPSAVIGNCVALTVGTLIPIADASNIRFTPNSNFDGVEVVFNYSAIDTNGNAGNVANYTFPMTFNAISGNVYHDVNGLRDLTVNGIGTDSTSANRLYVNLVRGGVVVDTISVSPTGTYAFTNLPNGTYTIQVTTTPVAIGTPTPTPTVTSNWVNTGENVGAGPGNDGTINGQLTVILTDSILTNANFGFNQRPFTDTLIALPQSNPGGTASITIPATYFSGRDSIGIVDTLRIISFPTNTTTLTINGTPYNSGNFPVGGVKVPVNTSGNPTWPVLIDPVDGSVTVRIIYTMIDNAGFEDLTPGFLDLPLIANTTYAVNDENSTWQEVPVSGNVLTNDFDLEANTIIFNSFMNPTKTGNITSGSTVSGVNSSGSPVVNAGTITFDGSGNYTYTPAAGFTGIATIPYRISDNGSPIARDTAILEITVSPFLANGNSVIANDDEYISNGSPVTGNIHLNDKDPQGNTFTTTAFRYDNNGDGIVETSGTLGTPVNVGGIRSDGSPLANAGSLTLNSNGTFTFTPVAGFKGEVTLSYTICDNGIPQACDIATINILVLQDINGLSNDPPFAGDDFSYTNINTAVTGNFFGNDSDLNGDSISVNGTTINTGGSATIIQTLTTVEGGTVQLRANGTYTYTPPTGYVGPDRVEYTICDVTVIAPQPLCDVAMIHLLVGTTNTTNAINDENSTWINTPVSGKVLLNDYDIEGNTQTFGSYLNPTKTGDITSGSQISGVNAAGSPVANAGTITFNGNGEYTFTPANDFTGIATVPYRLCDNGIPSVCDTALLQITVSPLPSVTNSIIANNDEYSTFGTTPVTGSVVLNDSDPQGNAFSVTTFQYDNNGDGTPETTGTTGTPVNVGGVRNDGTPLANAGSLTINSNGTFTFTPVTGFIGEVTLNYTICDSGLLPQACTKATVTITVLGDANGPLNNPPVAGDDFTYTSINTPTTGNFIGNDSDPNGDPISVNGTTINTGGPATIIQTLTTVQGGTVEIRANGTYTYTPPTGYVGPDRVEYTICDVTAIAPQPLCDNATIHLLVGSTNTTYAVNDENSTWINTPVSGKVLINDYDIEGNTQTFGSYLNPTRTGDITTGSQISGVNAAGSPVANAGTITFNGNGEYTFTPANDFTGIATVPYRLCDNGIPSVCDTALLQITVSPLPSVTNSIIANNDEYSTFGTTPVTGSVVLNDSDPQGNAFSVTTFQFDNNGDGTPETSGTTGTPVNVGGVRNDGTPLSNAGSLTLNSNGTFTFTAVTGFIGEVILNYTICDSGLLPQACTKATVTITVLGDANGPLNNPPVAGDDFTYTSINTPTTGNFIGNDSDPNGDPISVNGTTINTGGPATIIQTLTTVQGGTVEIRANGTYTYTPPTGYVGPDRVEYTICDVTAIAPQPLCDNATIHLLVGTNYQITGTVFNDANGNTRIDNSETPVTAVNQYVYLVNASGIIVDSSKVDSLSGNYILGGDPNQTYTVQLSTNQYPLGLNTNITPIVNSLPTGWARIGENGNNNTGNGDGTPDGRLTVQIEYSNVTNQNFALAPIPVADDKSYLGLDPNTLRFLPTGNITYPNKMVLNDPTGTQNGDVSLIDGTMPGKVSGSDLNAGLIAGATGTEGLRTFVTDGVVYDPNNNTVELTNTVVVYKFEGVDYILVPNPTNADPSYVFWNPTSGQYEIDNFNSNNLSVWFDTEGQTGFLFNYSWINTAGVKSNDASYLVNATGPLAILPVELLYFTAENVECNVQLRWATASEKNNDHFTLSKSTNLIDWELVTKVNGQGTTSLPQQYGYMDSKPLKGISYYRLSQTDYDGTMETFPVVSMDLNACITISTKIFPVPAKDILNIEVLHPNLSKGWINVYSSTGALVRQFLFTNSLNTVDVSLLPAGTYYVNILLEGKEYTHSFVISR